MLAPRRKTNLTKNKAQLNEATAQRPHLQATKITPNATTPKTKEEPSKTTMVPGQKMKTKHLLPCKTNQIGNYAILLARKKTMETIKTT